MNKTIEIKGCIIKKELISGVCKFKDCGGYVKGSPFGVTVAFDGIKESFFFTIEQDRDDAYELVKQVLDK